MADKTKLPPQFDPSLVICQPYTFESHSPGIFYGKNPLKFSFTLLLFEVSLVIVITRLVRYLLKPLKQPRIVSEIIGGIIIGPSCLGRNSTFSTYVLPDNGSYVMKTFGVLGFMYFLFMCGVKMDLTTINRAGKKHWYIALIGVAVPIVTTASIALAYRNDLPHELAKGASIWGVSSALAITAFPVIYTIIREFNLLSSDVGRMALSTAVIGDVIGINGVVAFEAAKQGETRPMASLWYMISLIIVAGSIIGGIRQVMFWIVRTTPEGKPVEQGYIIAILLGVMVLGFVSDFCGLAIDNGPLWLGLAVPDGPPLGATLVEKTETFILEILMPFSYVYVGLYTDIFSLSGHWPMLKPFFLMAFGAYITKLVATLAVSRFFKVPVRDSIALSLIMSLRGQVELILFIHWTDLQMITQPFFTMMVLLTTTVTAVAAPLISIVYDPTRPYIINKRRNIQHNPMNTELRILVPVEDEQSVPGLLSLLEVSNATVNSPFAIYALRLIELIGRASPLFIDHDSQEQQGTKYNRFNPIHNAFKFSQESRGEFIKIYPFTSVSPKKSMYQDICELALVRKVSLIILPFHKDCMDTQNSMEEVPQRKVQTLTSNVLAHAPCSVAVLVDRDPLQINQRAPSSGPHHFAVLFLGGADAREALAYADRMAGHPDVSLTVMRFLSYQGEGDDMMEKKLDDGLVTWFWVKNEGNSRVLYREVVVRNGEETLSAIRSMNQVHYDLWIVGRKQGINPVLLQGLENWSANHDLGVIGEYVASMDLGTSASVLVVQQQVLRDPKPTSNSFSFLAKEFSNLYR